MAKTKRTIPFTSDKYKQMQQKVADLEIQKEEVMERLVTAREMGDLSENGAYKYAKFELGNIKRQLGRLQALLEKGFPVPKQVNSKEIVEFGSQVTIQKIANSDFTKTLLIVSKHESDPSNGKVAYSSPLGKALMRKKTGDIVTVQTPRGEQQYTIISVK